MAAAQAAAIEGHAAERQEFRADVEREVREEAAVRESAAAAAMEHAAAAHAARGAVAERDALAAGLFSFFITPKSKIE